ncbi:MAG: response regulator [Deltaproteobacteria bacterium]|nr:response regulator [Deltaproteobacteria bacterium]
MARNKYRILVVDDHPDIRAMLVLEMESSGYEVFEARDGREAMTQVESVDFDLVIIDIAMPFVSGWEVGKSIKSSQRTRHIPILAITAIDTSENHQRCLQAGFDGFLPKPFSIPDLKARVEALLGRVSPQ